MEDKFAFNAVLAGWNCVEGVNVLAALPWPIDVFRACAQNGDRRKALETSMSTHLEGALRAFGMILRSH